MSSAPSVLLLTDVVDSTALGEQLGLDAAGRLWAAHDHAARDLLRQWRGREIDKSDGFLLLFGTVADAVGYAQAYHRLLGELQPPLRARVGIHCGPVLLRDNPPQDVALGAKPVEVEGSAKPLAARVMALALGGQTLLSADAQAALGTPAPPLRLQSHGHWRLKGLQAPVELFEVGDEHAPFTPPPDAAKAWRVLPQGELWLPRRELRHSLPAERDSFVGRAPALHELAQRFEAGARLVSLLGIGGAGKTRLAQRFGWTWLGDFPGGVWFCDLSQATSLDGVVHATAQGLELPLGPADPVQQIGQAIAGRGGCLVILDNFEQVARHAEATLGRWLDRAPEARFLVTSREVLGIVGEQVLALPPLPPADSVALFMQRALAATQDFAPSPQEQQAIEPLVQLLDGLPLAVELCAARVRVLPPSALLQRMSERFKLLTSSGGRRDRQATLRATLDWSWDLLSEPERSALAQLSVFEGGFTLEAAEAVIDLSAFDDPPWVVDVVQALVQKSLVRKVSDRRFDLLTAVQEFARGCLPSVGATSDEQAGLVMRHAHYFAAQDESVAVGPQCVDLENVVAACRRAIASSSAELLALLAARAWAGLRTTGPLNVALAIARSSSDALPPDHPDQGWVHWIAAAAHVALGDAASAERHIERAHAVGRGSVLARLWLVRGEARSMLGHSEDARRHLNLAREAFLARGDLRFASRALNALGALDAEEAQWAAAKQHYEQAAELAERVADPREMAGLLGNLGSVDHAIGDLAGARGRYRLALDLARQTGHRRWEANIRSNLGLLDLQCGCIADATVHFEAALAMARAMGAVMLECTVLCNLGLVADGASRLGEAVARYREALAIADPLNQPRLRASVAGYLAVALARLGEFAQAQALLEDARSALLALADRLALGLLTCQQARVQWLAGLHQDARQNLALARQIMHNLDLRSDSELGAAIQALDAEFTLD